MRLSPGWIAAACALLSWGCEGDIGSPCPTKCAVGPDVHCLEKNKLNGCSSSLCATVENEFTECLPCYDSASISEEAIRCLEGAFVRYESRSLGACTRTCDSDADCDGLANFRCRACAVSDKIDFAPQVPRTKEQEHAAAVEATRLKLQELVKGKQGVCAPPASEGSSRDPLLVFLELEAEGSCYVPLESASELRATYLKRARSLHPDRECEGYCTDFCSSVSDCPSSSGWTCEAIYTVGVHELVNKKVCVSLTD